MLTSLRQFQLQPIRFKCIYHYHVLRELCDELERDPLYPCDQFMRVRGSLIPAKVPCPISFCPCNSVISLDSGACNRSLFKLASKRSVYARCDSERAPTVDAYSDSIYEQYNLHDMGGINKYMWRANNKDNANNLFA